MLFKVPDKILDGMLIGTDNNVKFVSNIFVNIDLKKFLETKETQGTTRTLYISKTIRKKRNTDILRLGRPMTPHIERMLEIYAMNLERLKVLSLRQWIISKKIITNLYSLNLMYGDNECYYIALVEQTTR